MVELLEVIRLAFKRYLTLSSVSGGSGGRAAGSYPSRF